jgi:hypothetical protein
MNRHFVPPTESDIPIHGWAPYTAIHRERIRAHAKHDGNGMSMERKTADDPIWLAVLTEELGEVARCLCDRSNYNKLQEELVQLAAMTAAWIESIQFSVPLGSSETL